MALRKAKYWGFTCQFDLETHELVAPNWFVDKLFDVFIFIDMALSDGFYVEVEED